MSTIQELQQQNAQLQKELSALRAQLAGGQTADGQAACPSCPGHNHADSKQQQASCVVSATEQSSCSSSTRTFHSTHGLTKTQVERYSRQLLLPSFGIAAQGKLCSSSMLIVGCGGLGSPAALYLAAAGVGRLGLVDHDVVELSNMHRQVIHTEDRLGMHKAQSAAAAVKAVNSSVTVDVYLEGLQPANAVSIISQYDVVIDASDNAPTRYLINDACVACGIPLVSAAAVGTDGQLTVYNYGVSSPCYRCLFPECPAPANCSRCADAGVLGPVPGVMGVLQAVEAIKVVTGAGQVLSSKLLLYDALAGRFSCIKLRGRAAACSACGEEQHRVISRDSIAGYDYTTFTGGQRPNDGPPVPLAVLPSEQRITPRQLQQQLQAAAAAAGAVGRVDHNNGSDSSSSIDQPPVLLDVRPSEQFAVMSLPGAVSIPYLQLEQRFDEVLQLCGTAALQQQQQQVVEPAAAAGRDNGNSTAVVNDAPSGNGASSSCLRRVVVMCRRGNHSQLAVQRLRQAGVTAAVDVVGGYEAWAADVDEGMPVL